ncbi:MAG: terpene cyclase/mutase family protein [Actinomycetota bacterium]|nr:terpene cyclase/mutase family protein [Actinomycetota bacterium]
MLKRISAALVALSAASLALTAAISPAHADPAATSGLYGRADATYDGVFRQSLAILGLVANDVKPGKAAITWLLKQQCADGSFEGYRADTSKACGVSDPANYTGPDTNSTALALSALMAVNQDSSADAAGNWLTKNQNKDGGWPLYIGGNSDANSTGLVLAAIKLANSPSSSIKIRKGEKYLTTIKLSCASGGGLAYQKPGPANPSATAQAFIGLTGGLEVDAKKLQGNPICGTNTVSNAGSYLANSVTKSGALPNSFGEGFDYTSTAFAILGFVANSNGNQAVTKGTAALVTNASSYAMPAGVANPGALGLLLLVSNATSKKPTNFGGINLITALQQSQQ